MFTSFYIFTHVFCTIIVDMFIYIYRYMLMSVKGHHSPNSSTFELNDGLFMESNTHIEDILHELISRNLDGFQVFILIEFCEF